MISRRAKMMLGKPILQYVYYLIYIKKGNCVMGITGSVNTGKSHLGIKIGYEMDPSFDIQVSLVYSVEMLIKRSLEFIKYKGKPISLDFFSDIEDIRLWLKENMDDIYISPGKVIIMDEVGALGAYVREFFSLDNRTISKIIQIWRVLRMVCIFIVPEDLSLADSTIRKFINVEIRMTGIDKDRNKARCIAWKYIGTNSKTKEPIKARLRGCRYGGNIAVKPLPPKLAKAYEDYSKSEKISALIDMGREYKINKPLDTGRTKSIWDDIKYVKSHPEDFHNDRGMLTAGMIQLKLGVSGSKAQLIRQHIMKEKKT